jgi:hypothetical protein
MTLEKRTRTDHELPTVRARRFGHMPLIVPSQEKTAQLTPASEKTFVVTNQLRSCGGRA